MLVCCKTGIKVFFFFFFRSSGQYYLARIEENNTLLLTGLRFAVSIDYLFVSYTIFNVHRDGSLSSALEFNVFFFFLLLLAKIVLVL